jgi:predicted aspartyl protease
VVKEEGSLPISLLGMTFLKRLTGYGIRDGVLTIEW